MCEVKKAYSDLGTLEKITYSYKNDLFKTTICNQYEVAGNWKTFTNGHSLMDAEFGQRGLENLSKILPM